MSSNYYWKCKGKFGLSTRQDSTWVKKKGHGSNDGYHSCCGSMRAYRHKAGCSKNVDIDSDDLSDLKEINEIE